METTLEKYRGIHPGIILDRELKKRSLRKGPFALSLHEYPQTINAVTKGKRGLTPSLSLKIDRALGLEEGTMLILQAYYEIKKEIQKTEPRQQPDLSIIREILFWDTDINKIDWDRQYKYVIKRIFERGNSEEKKEALKFYGKDKVEKITGSEGITGSIPIMNQTQ